MYDQGKNIGSLRCRSCDVLLTEDEYVLCDDCEKEIEESNTEDIKEGIKELIEEGIELI